jgi:hypothetical protein
VSGEAAGFAIAGAGNVLFVVGWTVVAVGYRRWAQAAGVSFWRFFSTYGQERTDIRMGHAFESGVRFWRDVFSRDALGDPEAEGPRVTVRRGATLCAAGCTTFVVGWLVTAVALAE